jgi:hypothetical protein
MPVNSTHPDYDATLPAWLRARDVLAGEDAVKAAGEKYLPKLDAQTDDDYRAYLGRALFFNATARTAEGYLGLIFRREPTVKVPDDRQANSEQSGRSHLTPALSPERRGSASALGRALAEFLEDADLQGTALTAYAKNVVGEVVGVGRAGTLVDWADSIGGPIGHTGNRGQGRAYAVLYKAEQILNWRTERVNGRNMVTLVVLKEESTDYGPRTTDQDEFETEVGEQIRVLKLVRDGGPTPQSDSSPTSLTRPAATLSHSHGRGNGVGWRYVVEIWRPEREWTWRGLRVKWELVEARTPLRLGKPLPAIPFVFHGPQHSRPAISKLPLADIIAANLDHYRLDADFKHGLHYTALPTAYVTGFDKDQPLRIGSSTAWTSETVGATAGFLEFKGQGLQTFERAQDRDERLMAILGSRMLEAQKRVGETADAIELRQSGESSVLSTVALSVSDGLTHVLRWVAWWNSTEALPEDIGEDRVLVQLNTDFSSKGMASDELTAVVAAWQAGAISRETMFDLFRRGEVLPAGRSDEEEARLARASQREDGGLRVEDGGKRETGSAKKG